MDVTIHQEAVVCDLVANVTQLNVGVGGRRRKKWGFHEIIETYYSFPVFSTKVTLDYQLIVNPAYNRDRGPVSVLGVRVHAQY